MKKRLALLVLFAVLAGVSILISTAKGTADIPFEEIFAILGGTRDTAHAQILWNIRLPRTIVAALVGINLSLSGAILQAILRNPLADPHIIGISSGAGLAGIFIMLVLPGAALLITPGAFVGAMIAAALIYILAWKDGIRPTRIILAGVAVSAFLGAGISAMMILYSDRVQGALMWMVGGLSARTWPHVDMLLPYTIGAGLLTLCAAQRLNILQLGDDMARGIGLAVERTRILLTALAALLAASAVSVVGLLGFVGLIVPHAARLMIGSDYRFLLPAAALLGVTTLTLSDTVARLLFSPMELPVGIIMAALGAPFFLYLLRRQL
ncbi:iron chelate uptake ABC transporter, FeCT family, permease protein [Selenomonas sp. oral taxon 137 str. F0430]|uniref:FecCD family ABC transporter permease n=1 Tax=Selenomonas sp. oral taxon 137 TaxID=712531 RepID=UPI0001EB1707|nr:iron ABC transporter permease [Selenomonas sp. oral taxon 137]EFR39761.1 iron chelate uptake ABC transporter, FeCT family, permease protein [Selenomonas sp. oral taxon 137 str. F0430]